MSGYILQRDVCPSQRIKITQESHAEGRDRLKPGTCQRGRSASQDEIAQGSDNSTDHLQEADGQDAALAGMLSYADLLPSCQGLGHRLRSHWRPSFVPVPSVATLNKSPFSASHC